MLIYHFGSKERLIIEIIREIRGEERRALDELSREGASPDEVLAGLWRYLIAEERRDIFELCHEISALALREPERYRGFLDEMVADWVTPVARILVRSGCPPDEAPARARATVAGVRGLMLDLRATGDQRGVDEAIRVLSSIVAFPKAPTNL